MKIQMPLTITSASADSRMITGRIVTWDEVGSTSAGLTSFLPNSVPTKNVKLLLEHDRTRPIGRVVSMTSNEQGIDATFKIAETTAGTDALVEAATGLRDGFSIGLNVDAWDNKDGVMVVKAGNLAEVSLVSEPAIDSARVTDVAASENSEAEAEAKVEEATNQPTEGDAVESTTVQEEAPAEATVEASKAVTANKPVAYTTPRSPIINAASYLEHSIKAQRGNDESRIYVAAANSTTDNPGLIPTRQLTEVVNGLADNVRASIDSISTGTLPNAGLVFQIPKITQLPSVAVTDELDPTPNVNMESEFINVDVKSFKGAQTMSVELADRSDPLFFNEVIRNLQSQYSRATNEYNSAQIIAGATKTATGYGTDITAAELLAWVSAGAVSVYGSTFRFADGIVVSPEMWGRIMSFNVDGRPIYNAIAPQNAAGNAQPRSLRGSVNGLDLWVDTALTGLGDDSMYVINRDAYTWYESPRLELRTNIVSDGSISILLYGYGATATKIAAGAYAFNKD